MLFDYISIIFGILKMLIYKVIYFKRVKVSSGFRINHNFSIAIRKNVKMIIGNNCKMRNFIKFRIEKNGNVIIGNNCFFNDGVSINCQKAIKIGNNVSIGHNVIIIDHDHDYKNSMEKFICEDITIGNNVWIGANCVILKGSVIGDNSVIAAGTIVKGNHTNDSGKKQLIYDKRESKEVIIC